MSRYHKRLTDDQIILMEKLAEIEHNRWADWQAYIMNTSFKKEKEGNGLLYLSIPVEWWDNWDKQIITPYKQLSEEDKEKDREQVMRYLNLIK